VGRGEWAVGGIEHEGVEECAFVAEDDFVAAVLVMKGPAFATGGATGIDPIDEASSWAMGPWATTEPRSRM